MSVTNTYKGDGVPFWPLLKNLNDEVKLRLITLLSQSMTSKARERREQGKITTKKFLSKYNGCWKGEMTAEEINDAIRSNRTNRPPITFD